jgi:hypothetical protein
MEAPLGKPRADLRGWGAQLGMSQIEPSSGSPTIDHASTEYTHRCECDFF